MKIVLQRVKSAAVESMGMPVSKIGAGYLILVGFGADDTEETVDNALDRISKLRLFADAAGKTNLSVGDIGGHVLIVSQFTLYADCSRGNRPGFSGAGRPKTANLLYEYMLKQAKPLFAYSSGGIFGADMQVSLINDGPFTVMLEF